MRRTKRAERDEECFSKGCEHMVRTAEARPDGVSIMRAMKTEKASILLKREMGLPIIMDNVDVEGAQ